MTTRVPKLNGSGFRSWINGLDAFLFDCDGVLWRGDAAIAGASEMVSMMRQLGKKVVFVVRL